MDKCPSEEELLAILNPVPARASGTTRPVRQLEAHIASCESCRTVLALLLSEGAPSDAVPTSTGLRPGERVGHYRLGEVLGAGAMSVVYSALDERLDRTVALKVLRWDRGLGGADALLREEARALARVSSPFVVDVFDVGEHLGAVYIVMEMVVGETLRQFASGSAHTSARPTQQRVIEALVQAGTGLADAHATGVIHGDVKPENILICVDRDQGSVAGIRAKISDFGLALVPRRRGTTALEATKQDERISYEPREVLAGKSSFVGTPAYMSPELFTGTRPNAKSDQYAFCVTAYEVLAGERPFSQGRGEDVGDVDVDMLARIAMLPIPASAARALLRGLHPDPAKRHPNMRALVDALRPRKWGAGALVAGATLLASVVAGVVWLVATRPAQDRCRDEAQPAVELASAKTLEGFRSAFLATGSPSAAESARLVEAEWNRFLDEWRVARVSACHARAPLRDAASEPSGVETCLSARLTDARAFHDAVLRVTPASVGAVAEAVYQLPSPRSCLANASAREATGPNRSAAAPIRPETLAKLADARAHFYAGETAQARSLLAALQANLGAPGVGAGRDAQSFGADVAWLDGALAEAEDRFADAATSYEASAMLATRADDLRRAFAAEVALVTVLGYRLNRPEAARIWDAHAEALLDAQGSDVAPIGRERPRAALLSARGANAFGRGDYASATTLYAAALREQTAGDAAPTPALATTLRRLGQSERAAGDHRSAIEHGKQALALRVRFFGAAHRATAEVQSDLGGSYLSVGDLAHAKEALEAAYRTQATELGDGQLVTANTNVRLGNLALAQGDYRTARSRYTAGLSVIERLLGDRNPEVALARMNLAIAHVGEKNWSTAATLFAEAREGLQRTAPDNFFYLMRIRISEGELARIRTDHPAPEAALTIHRSALLDLSTKGSQDPRLHSEIQTEIGLDLAALQRWKESNTAFEHAWEAMPSKVGLFERSELICGWSRTLQRLPNGTNALKSRFETERSEWASRPSASDSPRERVWRACLQ